MDFNSFNDQYIQLPAILKTKLELFLSELNILFGTEKGSVLGKRTFGNSIEHYLWSTSYNTTHIESACHQAIIESCFSNTFFTWKVIFNVTRGASKDIGLLEVEIHEPDEKSIIANPQWVFK